MTSQTSTLGTTQKGSTDVTTIVPSTQEETTSEIISEAASTEGRHFEDQIKINWEIFYS